MTSDISTLANWIRTSPSTVFFGGAGVSTESGIPDFRGANGFYFHKRTIPLEQVLSIDFFSIHPEAYWEWFREVHKPVEANAAHRALATLEADGLLECVITQNIDGLHQRAGSRTVWELHGNWEHLLCTACGAGYPLPSISEAFEELVPICPRCHGQLRPDIVMYGEALNEDVISGAVQAIVHADLLIVAGTSLVVYPAAGLLNYFSDSHLVLMNATPTNADADADLIIRDPVAQSFERIMNELK